jgi:uncharacterized protein (TIGR01244 family)
MIQRFWKWLMISLVFSCSDGGPRPEGTSVAGITKAVTLGDMMICSQPSREGLKQLVDRGYKTVLSTRGLSELSWDERAEAESLGMTFVSIPMENPVQEITDTQVSRFDSAMTAANGPVVLHCGSGNRVSGLWAVWLVESRKIDPEEALGLASQAGMRSIQPIVRKRLGLETDAE